ncbi:AraC family transcriptional regulator [Paenibacillus sp. MWE-103]|uniref:AraC family transcriptional regulator n=1 Tax=Paenibacillus artemisiicola TaxID=1172618 RepID=A0ABS3WC66_9BACL|nr:helix-turn-helix domain-containing protein [Paenibacillus artemisiicola]MBO7745905.1 AraC family transcriptional regulator [Paenibacillus artemisiicola]
MSAATRGNENARIDPAALHPYLLFARRYAYCPQETTPGRSAYTNAVIIVEAGEGLLHLDDREYALKPGALVYIPAGGMHRWRADGADPMIHREAYFDWQPRRRPFAGEGEFFHYAAGSGEPVPAYMDEQPALRIEPVTAAADLGLWLSYHDRFLEAPGKRGGDAVGETIRWRGEFQVFLSRFLSAAYRDFASGGDPRIRELLRLVASRQELEERELLRYAAEAGLKRSRFYALFREETGLSPKHYMMLRKLQRIKCDLRQSDASITQIAEKYGYSSIHVLSKNFRKHIGVTPSEYRRQSRL